MCSFFSDYTKLGKVFIISAPSGTGKTSLVTALINKIGQLYVIQRVITYTTKQPRYNDVNGIDYHFISLQEFEQKIQQHYFIEWSNDYGAYYGSPRYIINELQMGKSFILILDRSGARAVKNYYPHAILIWLTPPNLESLAQRLCARASDSIACISQRLELAQKELAQEQEEKLFEYSLVNNNFIQTLAKLELLIVKQLKN